MDINSKLLEKDNVGNKDDPETSTPTFLFRDAMSVNKAGHLKTTQFIGCNINLMPIILGTWKTVFYNFEIRLWYDFLWFMFCTQLKQ